MGNLLIRKKKFYKSNNQSYVNLLDDFDSSVSDLNLIQFNRLNLENKKDLKTFQRDMIIMLSNINNKITKLETVNDNNVNQIKKQNNDKIYNINERINLIHKDLKSLINNDQILLENYQKIIEKINNEDFKNKEDTNEDNKIMYSGNQYIENSDNITFESFIN